MRGQSGGIHAWNPSVMINNVGTGAHLISARSLTHVAHFRGGGEGVKIKRRKKKKKKKVAIARSQWMRALLSRSPRLVSGARDNSTHAARTRTLNMEHIMRRGGSSPNCSTAIRPILSSLFLNQSDRYSPSQRALGLFVFWTHYEVIRICSRGRCANFHPYPPTPTPTP